jgi:hypothetical protein
MTFAENLRVPAMTLFLAGNSHNAGLPHAVKVKQEEEQPQRGSNPCLHLERVPPHYEQRTLWDSDGQ